MSVEWEMIDTGRWDAWETLDGWGGGELEPHVGLIFSVTQPEEPAFATHHETNVLWHSFTCVRTDIPRGCRLLYGFTQCWPCRTVKIWSYCFIFFRVIAGWGGGLYVGKAFHPSLCRPLAVASPMSINKRLTHEVDFQFAADPEFGNCSRVGGNGQLFNVCLFGTWLGTKGKAYKKVFYSVRLTGWVPLLGRMIMLYPADPLCE